MVTSDLVIWLFLNVIDSDVCIGAESVVGLGWCTDKVDGCSCQT